MKPTSGEKPPAIKYCSLQELFGGIPFHSDPHVRLVTLEDWGSLAAVKPPPVLQGGPLRSL